MSTMHHFRIDGPLNRSVAKTLRPHATPDEIEWLIQQAKNWDSIRENHWVETGRWLPTVPPLFREKSEDDKLKTPPKQSNRKSRRRQLSIDAEKLRAILRDLNS